MGKITNSSARRFVWMMKILNGRHVKLMYYFWHFWYLNSFITRFNYMLMKNLFALLILCTFFSCTEEKEKKYDTLEKTDGAYTYQTVVGDPMNTRIYSLANGLKVYLSDYKNAPRVQVYVAVNAGGKNDPAENTGLAHYLEHIMFKGNDKFGTIDYESEKVLLDSIEAMFNHYSTLTDTAERKAFYKQIDAVSNIAAQYAIPNEYDKMISALGGDGLNAYTANDRTVYTVDIPSNEMSRFLELEGSRFKTITNRLFHTELEAVYEEKNRALDSDWRKMYETTLQALFKKHPYGTQLNIGTIEHLKNPSITAIKQYFDTYYKPNNVAICISGDIDYSKTIKLVDEYFGDWKPNETLTSWEAPVEDSITTHIEKEVFGPSAEAIYITYRFGGIGSEENRYVMLADMVLNNSKAGLIDLNLKQQQKVLSAGCSPMEMNDYTMHQFSGTPKQGQSLDEVKDLIFGQIELLKKGAFEDWLIPAVIADFKKTKMESLESNQARANEMVMAFTNGIDWAEYLQELDKMENITKEELVAFVNKNYKENFVVIYKRSGEDPNKQQVEKPYITKVQMNRDVKSAFHEALLSKEVEKLKPVFVDYEKDLDQTIVKGIQVLSKQNTENELFDLIYLLDIGKNENPKLAEAAQYLQYIGPKGMSAEDFQKELYKLGCDFSVSASDDRTYITLSGLDENMEASTQLFEKLLSDPSVDQETLDNLVGRKLQGRENVQKNKQQILMGGLFSYAKYGEESPYTNVLTNEELKNLRAEELASIIQSITKMEHRILYYGPRDASGLESFLTQYHAVPASLASLPEKVVFEARSTEIPLVYWTNYDMVQSEILMVHKAGTFDHKLTPTVQFFNEYFGGGMNSIVFQEIREAQGLAYSVYAGYSQPMEKGKPEFLFAYLGTQADKQPEAMKAIVQLMNEFPESEMAFGIAKEGIINKLESDRVTKSAVLWNYISAQDAGLDYDIRSDIYSEAQTMTFADLKAFQQQYIKDQTFITVLIGAKDKIDFEDLRKYGEVRELKLNELFGFE